MAESSTRKGKLAIVADGFDRLLRSRWCQQKRAAVVAQVRAKHAEELARAADYWQRIEIEDRITRELKRELEAFGSPHCLWFSR